MAGPSRCGAPPSSPSGKPRTHATHAPPHLQTAPPPRPDRDDLLALRLLFDPRAARRDVAGRVVAPRARPGHCQAPR